MQQHDIWFPEDGIKNARIVGRFVDEQHTLTNGQGEKKTHTFTMLQHRVPGSQDVSASVVKNNSEGAKLKARFKSAWADYEKRKATEPAPVVPTSVEHGIKGTPIEEADFIGADRMAFFKSMGFLTVEQLAGMSDAVCANFSGGLRLRKKAAEHLASAKA